MQPFAGNQRPGGQTSHIASLQILFKGPTLAIIFGRAAKHTRLAKCRIHRPCHEKRRLTSKSGPNMVVCFAHINFHMCFAAEWYAFFQPLNFQKCSMAVVFLPWPLPHVLRATTACSILTSTCTSQHNTCICCISHREKVVGTWCALYVLTCFAPEWCAICQLLYFQKCSMAAVFLP